MISNPIVDALKQLKNFKNLPEKKVLQILQKVEDEMSRFYSRKKRIVCMETDPELLAKLKNRDAKAFYMPSNSEYIKFIDLDVDNEFELVCFVIHEGLHALLDDGLNYGKVRISALHEFDINDLIKQHIYYDSIHDKIVDLTREHRTFDYLQLFDSFYAEEMFCHNEQSYVFIKYLLDSVENTMEVTKILPKLSFPLTHLNQNVKRGKKLEGNLGTTYQDILSSVYAQEDKKDIWQKEKSKFRVSIKKENEYRKFITKEQTLFDKMMSVQNSFVLSLVERERMLGMLSDEIYARIFDYFVNNNKKKIY